MSVKVGIFMFATRTTIDVVSLARTVEELGFESLFLPEHAIVPRDFSSPYPGGGPLPDEYRMMLDPFVALAAAAGATRHIRLGTAIALVPERHPLLSAKAVATLDQVSRGRFIYGVGCGWLKEEGEIFKVDWKRRWTQTRDYIQAMKVCWSEPVAEYMGSHTRFPRLICDPKPVQQPHPPILIGGDLEKAAERIAEFGDGWIPRYLWTKEQEIAAGRARIEELYRARGRDVSKLDITLFGCPAKRERHRAFGDAGVTRIVHVMPMEPGQATLDRLKRLADAVL